MKHLLLLLLLLPAGCATRPAGPQACVIDKVLELPVNGDGGRITVPALLDGKSATLILATGAEPSSVTPTTIRALQLRTDPRVRTTLTDVGGSITTQNAMLRSMKIGDVEMLEQSVSVAPMPSLQSVNAFSLAAPQAADGALGADWLSGFDVEIDLPHGRAALYRAHGCDGDYVPWSEPKSSVNAEIYGRGLVLLNVTVDGHVFKAKVDSATTTSLIGSTAVAAANLAGPDLAHDPAGSVTGSDQMRLQTRLHRFNSLQIGPIRYVNPALEVANLHLRQSNLLLGLNWLQHNRVWISYATQRVTIQAESPPTL
jgi:hypothetical protein